VVRSVAVKVLTSLGYRVTESADPLAALEVYRDNWQTIDLVLLDMMMPHMNGRQLFENLREINPAVAAVLMSGYDATGTMDGATGFVGFISKPYTLQELATIVRQSLSTSCRARVYHHRRVCCLNLRCHDCDRSSRRGQRSAVSEGVRRDEDPHADKKHESYDPAYKEAHVGPEGIRYLAGIERTNWRRTYIHKVVRRHDTAAHCIRACICKPVLHMVEMAAMPNPQKKSSTPLR